jgi:hypothetical protein
MLFGRVASDVAFHKMRPNTVSGLSAPSAPCPHMTPQIQKLMELCWAENPDQR